MLFAGLSKLHKIRSSPSAGLGRQQRPDAWQELKRGCLLALHVPEHQGSSDKRSVNNWWCSSLEQSHRANGGWKTWTLEKGSALYGIIWHRGLIGQGKSFFYHYVKDEVVTVETFLPLIWQQLILYSEVLKEKPRRQQIQHLATRPSRDHSPHLQPLINTNWNRLWSHHSTF